MADATWQPYTDGLVSTQTMNSATICALNNNDYWAYTGDNIPQPDEVAHINACLLTPDKARAEGVRIAGVKYFVMRAEPGMLLGKAGGKGFVAMSSVQAFTLAVFEGDSQPMHGALREVETMVNNFKDLQY